MKEWEKARETIENLENNMHDLRKYGFSFITALLAAESLLIPAGSSSTALPDSIKVAVLAVTLILIVTLHLIDRNYQALQSAAASRAKILERTLNLQLTEVMSLRYRTSRVQWYVTGVYAAFTVGVLVLGSVVLYPNYIYIIVLWLAAIIALIFVMLSAGPNYPYGRIDWTLDRLKCKAGEEVGITLTNLYEKEIKFEHGQIILGKPGKLNKPIYFKEQIIFKIVREDDGTVVKIEKVDQLSIIGGDSHTWFWKIPPRVKEGMYSVHRAVLERRKYHLKPEYSLRPLLRKLRISSKVDGVD
jgi:hypothetical protein